jgi:hypothetical protein
LVNLRVINKLDWPRMALSYKKDETGKLSFWHPSSIFWRTKPPSPNICFLLFQAFKTESNKTSPNVLELMQNKWSTTLCTSFTYIESTPVKTSRTCCSWTPF